MKYPKERKAELLIGLWNHCNNRCAFCYNQTLFDLPKNLQQHLDMCKDMLKSNFMNDFDYLRFLGGELFDGSMEKLNVKKDFFELMDLTINLLKENKLEKVNFLTNLIYDDNTLFKETLSLFAKNNLINKVELSTSYDVFGRFHRLNSEDWWWNNIKWINDTYPDMPIYIGIIMTQPFITTVTKDWLDDFCSSIKNQHIYFIELDTAILKRDKEHSPFKNLFPKRVDFLKFLNNLKDWGYYDALMKADGSDPWSTVDSIQLVHLDEFSFPIFKNQHFLLAQRKAFREDGYIDSDVPLFDDVRKILHIK
ncbi:MAG: hypothetical protein IJ880_11495 [Bacilli bacterium]|nr:hypothetical protein [Bacilli bacterium]